MTYVDVLHEDFFQRVINVNWDTEPECYFMAGDASTILNGLMPYGGGNVWRSGDGRSWAKVLNNMDKSGLAIGGLACGVWMRQLFNPKASPVWVMGGQRPKADDSGVGPAIAYSFDTHQVTVRDQHPIPTEVPGPQTVWQMYVNGPAFAPTNASADIIGFTSDNVLGQIYTIDGVNWDSAPSSAPPPPPSPPAPKVKNVRQLYQLSNRKLATGKVREGQFKGRALTLNGMGGDKHHFTSSIQVTDQKTGTPIGVFDSGIQFGRSLAYGHYVFCITGGIGAGKKETEGGYIAWSDDGYTWHPQRLSDLEMWALVVGPRK